jgi:ABC-2 type transport system permease protein
MPLRSWEIILAKYLAALFLVAFSLLPTLLYYYTVYQLGNPVGNLDTSGIIGSYIGLFLLGGVFVSIGLLTSSITENQIISFILAAFFCFFFYEGFQAISAIDVFGGASYYLEQLGIAFHYASMSKGVLDLRDIVYFVGLIFLFLLSTRLIIETKK